MSGAARSRWVLALVLIVTIAIVWTMRRKPQPVSTAFVADRSATLWSTTAQVRQPVATLGFGERVTILRRSGDQVEVRTDDGAQGWLDVNLTMDETLWQKEAALLERARSLPVQAVGHSRNLSNVHIEPGRDTPRIFQFERDVPLAVFQRKALPAPVSATAESQPGAADNSDANAKPKQEDWLLVSRLEGAPPIPSAQPALGGSSSVVSTERPSGGRSIPVAGWVLARFVDLDPPAPIPDYANAAGLRIVSWAVLNRVPDASGDKPQFVVAGARGPEGQPCDFTLLRVYTWDANRQQYETAFVDSDVCGTLPISVRSLVDGAEFTFSELDEGGRNRVYRMKQTVVRRVRDDRAPAAAK